MAGLAWAKDYHRQWVKMNYIMSNGLSPTPINAPGWLNSGVASLLVNGHVPQGLELTNQNLAGLVFPHGDLSQVALIGCDLRFANLEGADLTDANLIAASLHKSNLRRANLCRATLNRCNLSEADLTESDANEALFCQAVFTEVEAHGLRLYRAKVSQAQLMGAHLQDRKSVV